MMSLLLSIGPIGNSEQRCCQLNPKHSPFGAKLRPNGGTPMPPVSFKRHGFPPGVIRLAVWHCSRFTVSLRDVEELLLTVRSANIGP
jgi:hypothetical protein